MRITISLSASSTRNESITSKILQGAIALAILIYQLAQKLQAEKIYGYFYK